MRKTFLMLSLFLSVGILKAQLNTFDLSSYKLPEITRHQLDLDFRLSGRNQSYDNYQRNGTDYYRKLNGINGNFGLDYSYLKNSSNYQGNQYFGFGLNPSFTDQKDEEELLYESIDFYSNVGIFSENKFYINSKFFLESNLSFSYRYNNEKENNNTQNDKYKRRNTDVNIPLGFGFGRIEPVQDAWLAIYILEELKENSKLKRVPNNEEILEFASIISQLKNERFFDARLQKMREIEEVDKFLQSKGLISEPDSRYFTVINDNWDNVATQLRQSGKRFSFLLETGYSSDYSLREQIIDGIGDIQSESQRREYNAGASINFNYENPINLKWQSSFDASFSGNYFQGIDEDIDNNITTEVKSPQLKSNIYYRISYYPSSRTNLYTSIGLNFLNAFGTEDDEIVTRDISHFELRSYMGIGLNYYISPQFLLNARYTVQYNHEESNSEYYSYVPYDDFIKDKLFYQSISISFVYKLF